MNGKWSGAYVKLFQRRLPLAKRETMLCQPYGF